MSNFPPPETPHLRLREITLVWGFEQMQLNRIEANVHPENQACLKLLERLGFVQEGRLRQAGFWLGEHHDLLQFSLLRAEFEPSPISAPQ